jgi:hypothetical protein
MVAVTPPESWVNDSSSQPKRTSTSGNGSINERSSGSSVYWEISW